MALRGWIARNFRARVGEGGIAAAERVGLLRPSWPQALRARRCAPSKIAPGDFVEPPCLMARGFKSRKRD